MSDSKSQLNLYCQRFNISNFPKYDAIPILVDKSIKYTPRCFFKDKEYKIDTIVNNKKEADQSIAEYILTELYSTNKDQIEFIPKNPMTLIIDLDNQGSPEILEKLRGNQVLAVGGPRINIPNIDDPDFVIFNTKSTNKDAADIELAFLTGKMIKELKYKQVRIYSTDYALATLVVILNQSGFQAQFKCKIEFDEDGNIFFSLNEN